jgi:hypothetical protein
MAPQPKRVSMESAMIPPLRARDEWKLHAFAAHREAVGDGEGVEDDRHRGKKWINT